MAVRSIRGSCKIALIGALTFFGLVGANADSGPAAQGEIALYKQVGGNDTIAVTRNSGQVQLSWCREAYFPPANGKPAPDAAAKFAQANCYPAPVTSLSSITGGTNAVATIAQSWVHPANSAKGGEMTSALLTYKINVYPTAPVGLSDSVIYTGAAIVFDHDEVPKLETVRVTFELVAVTRAK